MTDSPLPYGRQSLDDDDIEAVIEVLRSDWLTTGPVVEQFEERLAVAAATRHAVALSSGTAAVHTGYAALGLGPGTSLVTSPLTFAATATAALHLGARVVFADVDAATGNLDPAAAGEALSGDTRVVTAVDFAGHPSDYPALRRLADERGCALFSDAAHSFGARLCGRAVTELADAAALSFHPVKAMTTAEGGALVTSDAAIADAGRAFRNHGIVREAALWRRDGGSHYYEVQTLGLNYRLPDLLCALGLSQLGKLESFLQRRREIAGVYTRAFGSLDAIEIPDVAQDAEPGWHLYVIRVREAGRRDALFEALREAGLGVQVHYPPAHTHPLFEDIGFRRGQFPAAEDYAARAISLPIYPALTDEDVERVVAAVVSGVASTL